MSSIVAEIAQEAASEERRCRRRAQVAHVTHYVAGLGGAVAAALAAYLANVGDAAAQATVAGSVGAVLAAVVTFMNPRSRAAFQYAQSADYGDLRRSAQRVQDRADDDRVQALSQRLTELRRRVASDLQQTAP